MSLIKAVDLHTREAGEDHFRPLCCIRAPELPNPGHEGTRVTSMGALAEIQCSNSLLSLLGQEVLWSKIPIAVLFS